MADLCKHCGKSESEHHAFEAVVRAVGCVCDPRTWTRLAGPICGEFQPYRNSTSFHCINCYHDRACHAPKD